MRLAPSQDVGQNTIELWNLKSGGGWIHPIHVHLVVRVTSEMQIL
jgi:FtsP/CotA-like multicopper oxidase with cupredoxin domain